MQNDAPILSFELPIEFRQFIAIAASRRRLPASRIIREALILLAEEELPPKALAKTCGDPHRILATMLDTNLFDNAEQIVLVAILRYAHEYDYLPSHARTAAA